MINSIFIALSGMQAHQRGLDVISNNVANLNTPGFRGSSVSFADVFTGNATSTARDAALFGQSQTSGGGVDATRVLLDEQAGQQQQTGRDLDLFLKGEGFFVLQREDGSTAYTRNGAFTFQDGVLVASDLKSKVMARNAEGALVPIELGALQTNAGKATATITLSGNLSPKDDDFTISSLVVFDKTGASHTVNIVFTRQAQTGTQTGLVQWDVKVLEGADTIGEDSISFVGNILTSGQQLPIALALKGTDPASVTLDFSAVQGNPTDPSDQNSKASTLAVQKQDGFGPGKLTGETFDDNGVLKLSYSNGQTTDGPKLVLASITDTGGLNEIGGSQFAYHGNQAPVLRAAGNDLKVVGGSLEGSNVDLTREFSELILMQRGYQASSEVLSTVNQMLQQLFDTRGQR